MKKILIIDDDPALQSLTAKVIQAQGYQTLSAADGLEGLDLARKYNPDLIICDIQMPNMDGYETLAALQKDPLTSAIPFIFLTAVAGQKEVRFGMGLGADDYLTKPFTVKELAGAVATRLAKKDAVRRISDKKLVELRENIGMALPHELLTPLNGILGLSGMLTDEGAPMEMDEVRNFARDIQVSALRLHRLISNFVVYSELEMIASDPKRIAELRRGAPTPIREIVIAAAKDRASAAVREEDLVLDVQEAEVVMAPERVRRVTEELVENAFKFSTLGNPVRLATRIEGRQLALSVTDQGRGMTPEQIASIGAHMQFERRFYEQQGAGLGLIIAKRLAELHGGDLTIDSVDDMPTTVQILLPLPRPMRQTA